MTPTSLSPWRPALFPRRAGHKSSISLQAPMHWSQGGLMPLRRSTARKARPHPQMLLLMPAIHCPGHLF